MTIQTSTSNELTIDQIVRQAYLMAGLLNAAQGINNTLASQGRILLDTILKELENEGIFAKSVAFDTITLVSGQFQYDMPTNCLDVFGIAMWISADQASTPNDANELPVQDIDRDRWQRLTSKDSASRPLMYYCHRELATPQVWLWPQPSATENGSLIRFQVHRFRSDATQGAATLDYERYWTQFFIWELAHQLSVGSGKGIDRCQYLAAQAAQKKKMARMYSAQRPDQRFTVGYLGSGRRRR